MVAARLAQQSCADPQHIVSDEVREAIVDPLEVVEVEQHKCDWAGAAGHQLPELRVEVTAVRQSGDGVDQRLGPSPLGLRAGLLHVKAQRVEFHSRLGALAIEFLAERVELALGGERRGKVADSLA